MRLTNNIAKPSASQLELKIEALHSQTFYMFFFTLNGATETRSLFSSYNSCIKYLRSLADYVFPDMFIPFVATIIIIYQPLRRQPFLFCNSFELYQFGFVFNHFIGIISNRQSNFKL